jgi:hypothetical protein
LKLAARNPKAAVTARCFLKDPGFVSQLRIEFSPAPFVRAISARRHTRVKPIQIIKERKLGLFPQ